MITPPPERCIVHLGGGPHRCEIGQFPSRPRRFSSPLSGSGSFSIIRSRFPTVSRLLCGGTPRPRPGFVLEGGGVPFGLAFCVRAAFFTLMTQAKPSRRRRFSSAACAGARFAPGPVFLAFFLPPIFFLLLGFFCNGVFGGRALSGRGHFRCPFSAG